MKDDQKQFSLSNYFDELGQKKKEKSSGPLRVGSSFSAQMSVIKSLMTAENHTMPFMALARSSQLKLDVCQEIVNGLQDEGIVEVEPDYNTGNDKIKLTQKGKEVLP
ncbi:MAG: hypothetical protein ACMUHX_04580 [bacterium]